MKFKYKSTDKKCFSLHDCKATEADLKDNVLTFYFPEGIFYHEYADFWPNTGSGAVEYFIEYLDEVTFYLFEKSLNQKVVKEYNVSQLVDKINSKKWQLEFLYRYDGYKEVMFTVMVWFNRKPYSYEGQLFIRNVKETFMWNPLEDKDLLEE